MCYIQLMLLFSHCISYSLDVLYWNTRVNFFFFYYWNPSLTYTLCSYQVWKNPFLFFIQKTKFSFTFHNLSSPRIIASEFFFCCSPSTPMKNYPPFFRFIFLFQIYPPSKTDLHYSPFKDFTWSSVFNFALLATASLCELCILIPWQHNQ